MQTITFNFKEEGLAQNLQYFVSAEPVPTGGDGKPLYTPAQWWKQWVILKTRQAMQKGKNKIEQQELEKDVIT